MWQRYADYFLSILIVCSVLFLALYSVFRLFASQGTYLQQGYIETVNLNNVAVGAVIALGGAVIISKIAVKMQTKATKIIRLGGFYALCLVAILWLIWAALVIYALSSGHLLDGWQF